MAWIPLTLAAIALICFLVDLWHDPPGGFGGSGGADDTALWIATRVAATS